MTQIVLGAPKIKFLIPKKRPPSFSLTEGNISKENIQTKINEEDDFEYEHKISNKVYTILDFYKEKSEEKIYSPNIKKTFKQKESNKSIETRCSENDTFSLD